MDFTDLRQIAAISARLFSFVLLFRPFFGKSKNGWECVASA